MRARVACEAKYIRYRYVSDSNCVVGVTIRASSLLRHHLPSRRSRITVLTTKPPPSLLPAALAAVVAPCIRMCSSKIRRRPLDLLPLKVFQTFVSLDAFLYLIFIFTRESFPFDSLQAFLFPHPPVQRYVLLPLLRAPAPLLPLLLAPAVAQAHRVPAQFKQLHQRCDPLPPPLIRPAPGTLADADTVVPIAALVQGASRLPSK